MWLPQKVEWRHSIPSLPQNRFMWSVQRLATQHPVHALFYFILFFLMRKRSKNLKLYCFNGVDMLETPGKLVVTKSLRIASICHLMVLASV